MYPFFFSVRERAEFCKACNLIGFGSGQKFSILPKNSGEFVAWFVTRPWTLFLAGEIKMIFTGLHVVILTLLAEVSLWKVF